MILNQTLDSLAEDFVCPLDCSKRASGPSTETELPQNGLAGPLLPGPDMEWWADRRILRSPICVGGPSPP